MLAACIDERPRPGPPIVTLTLEKTGVRSTTPPDTLRGTVDASDPDGLDSVWVSVDSVESGEDAGFDPRFISTFAFLIGPGKSHNTHIPVQIRARDLAGFSVVRDTYVVVVP